MASAAKSLTWRHVCCMLMRLAPCQEHLSLLIIETSFLSRQHWYLATKEDYALPQEQSKGIPRHVLRPAIRAGEQLHRGVFLHVIRQLHVLECAWLPGGNVSKHTWVLVLAAEPRCRSLSGCFLSYKRHLFVAWASCILFPRRLVCKCLC